MKLDRTILSEDRLRPRGRVALYIPLSFLLPLFVILAALAGMQVTPFGDKTLVISDADGLYINTLSYAGRMLRGLEGITYSFEKGLGGNMTGHLNGILLTPFAFLFSLSDIADYPAAFTFVSALNFCLGGLTMYLLLASLYGHRRSNLIFSTAYALVGFNVANVFQAVFFCAVPALPLMVLGLRWLFQGRSPLLYLLSITYGMLSNGYFGFVLCVASVLFFFTQLWLKWEELKGKRLALFVRYVLSSLLGGLLVAALWMPSILSLQGGRLDQTKLSDFSFWENMPFLEIGAKLFTGANSTSELVNGLPNIYVGILPVALSVLFFLNRSIGKREKAAGGFLLGFYLLSFWFVALNMLMHGGTTTNWFNYRYSYVFSFLLLMLAAAMWQRLEEASDRDLRRCFVGMLLVTALIFSQRYEFVKGGAVLLDFALLLLVFLAWRMHRKRPEVNPRKTFERIVLLLVCLGLFLNYRICTMKIMDWGITASEYAKTVRDVGPLVEAVQASDHSFFRMEVNRQRSGNTGNDPMLYGYNGVGHGGSNERNFVRSALCKLGVQWYDMRNYYAEGIPAATDTLLGLKYLIAREDLTEEKDYKNVTNFAESGLFSEEESGCDLYYNADALSVALLSGPGIDGVETDFTDVFDNLNRVWAAVSGREEAVFLEEEDIAFTSHSLADPLTLSAAEAREITASYDVRASAASVSDSARSSSLSASISRQSEDGPPEYVSYIEYRFTAKRSGPVYVYKRSSVSELYGSDLPAIEYLGSYAAGEEVVGYIPVTGDYVHEVTMEEVCGRLRAAYADLETLHALSALVKERPVTVEKEKETRLTGTFTARAGEKLVFTIPRDAGWTCLVDGEEAELHEVLGVFMALDAPEGSHSFELRYTPVGLRTGLILSAAALVLVLLYLGFLRRRLDRVLEKKRPDAATEGEIPETEEKTEAETAEKTEEDTETEATAESVPGPEAGGEEAEHDSL